MQKITKLPNYSLWYENSAAMLLTIILLLMSFQGRANSDSLNLDEKTEAAYALTVDFDIEFKCTGKPTFFRGNVSGASNPNNLEFRWSFDSDNDFHQNASYKGFTYHTPDTYTVTLEVREGSSGFIYSKTKTFTVNQSPIADFSASSAICSGVATSFTNSSSGSGTLSYSWTFGDGGQSNLENPSHTYSSAGSYKVRLTVTSSTGCSSVQKEVSITVGNGPSSNFTFTDVCDGESVQFTNTSTNQYQSTYLWHFGGAHISTQQNPTFTFNGTGSFPVRLEVTNQNGCKHEIIKNVTIKKKPTPNFAFTNDCEDKSIQFTNSSSGNGGTISSYLWEFNDGKPNSSATNPSHVFDNSGTYNVKLTVTNTNGCKKSITKAITIYAKPTANFTAPTGYTGKNTQFNHSATGNVASYLWTFGDDNSTSTASNPTHQFDTEGTFPVTLKVTSSNGCVSTITKDVTVYPSPTASFTAHNFCVGQETFFRASVTGGSSIDYKWKFEPTHSSDYNDEEDTDYLGHVYGSTGTYTVTLTVRNEYGQEDTFTDDVTIYNAPKINSITAPDFGCTGVPINFSANVTGSGFSYNWNIDGTTYTTANPSHTFNSGEGTKNVSLTVSLANSSPTDCVDTKSTSIGIKKKPSVKNLVNAGTFCATTAGQLIKLDGTETGVKYQLYRGTTAIGSPISTGNWGYQTAKGTYFVKAQVEDGCSGIDMEGEIIINDAPTADFSFTNMTCQTKGLVNFDASLSQPAGGQGRDIVEYIWDFGDGTPEKTSTNPTYGYVYQNEGNFNVELKIKDQQGCEVTSSTKQVTIVFPTVVTGTLSNKEVCLTDPNGVYPDLVLNGAITGTVQKWRYKPEGGSWNELAYTGTILSSAAGLKITKTTDFEIYVQNGTCEEIVKSAKVTVVQSPKGGTIEGVNLCEPGDAYLTLTGQVGDIEAWQKWNGSGWDNISGSANVTNISEDISVNTIFRVKVSVEGCEIPAYSNEKTIQVFNPPVSDFRMENQTGQEVVEVCVDETVVFNNLSSAGQGNTISSYFWDFGDGNTSTSANPTHSFSTANGIGQTYNVTLRIENDKESVTGVNCFATSEVKTIKVHPKPIPEIEHLGNICVHQEASFTATNSTIPPGYVVKEYRWDFDGNGSFEQTSTEPMVTHRFDNEGAFNVGLEIEIESTETGYSESCTAIDATPATLTVYPEIEGNIMFADSNGDGSICLGEKIDLNIHDVTLPEGWEIEGYIWDIDGDGTFAIEEGDKVDNTKTFTSEDNSYKVSVLVKTNYCDQKFSKTFDVEEGPSLSFTYQESCTNTGEVVFTVNDPVAGYTYGWDFDISDGQNSEKTGQQVSHIFEEGGTYSVMLMLNNTDICSKPFVNPDVKVTLFQSAGEIVNGDISVCQDDLPTLLASKPEGVGQFDTYTYQWQHAATDNPADFVDIAGATQEEYEFPAFNQSMLDKTFYRRKVTSTSGCFDFTEPAQVTIDLIPDKPVIDQSGPISLCFGSSVELSVPENPNYEYIWYKNGFPLPWTAGNHYFNASYAGLYTVAAINNGCESEISDPIEIIIHQAEIYNDEYFNLQCSEGSGVDLKIDQEEGYHYKWYKDNTEIGTGNVLNVTTIGDYKVRSFRNADPSCYTDAKFITVADESVDHNYVRTYVAQTPSMAETVSLSTATAGQVAISTQYIDGLGRQIQQVDWQASPALQDLVTFTQYDQRGRETKGFLPYAKGTNGEFKQCAEPEQKAFYLAGGDQIANTSFAYSITQFENSPLNRVEKQAAPGDAWAGSLGTGTEHVVNVNQRANTGDAVVLWRFVNEGDVVPTASGAYEDRSLMVNETKDEAGNEVKEFTNKKGEMVLKRIASDEGWAETYYVHDNIGNLRFVIPPKAANILKDNSTITEDIRKELCFTYLYDDRNRVVEKQVPGAGPVYMIYDKLDRVILTQDAVQRENMEWLFTKYDVFSRPVMTGIYSPGKVISRAEMVTEVKNANPNLYVTESTEAINKDIREDENIESDAFEGLMAYNATDKIKLLPGFNYKAPVSETFEAVLTEEVMGKTERLGVNNNSTFPSDNFEVLTVSYYDTYNLDKDGNPTGEFEKYTSVGAVFDQEHSATDEVKGIMTASKVRVLGGGGRFLTTVMFYDDRGRVIQTKGENNNGGIDVMTSQFDFVGRPTRTYMQHENPKGDLTATNILKKYFYDHTGRVTSINQIINDNQEEEEIIVQNTYNELNALISKNLGEDLQTIDYAYNIRGWIESINDLSNVGTGINGEDKLFAMVLNYEVEDLYNGNIGEILWKSASDQVERSYAYTYDKMSRLRTAVYSSGNTNEKFNVDISYDENGNILTLNREGLITNHEDPLQRVYGQIDALTYKYNANDLGNKLAAVSDGVGSVGIANGFKEKSLATSGEYRYDENGNLTADDNKGISEITYNHLNLPATIDFGGGKMIKYQYNAAGIKLRKTVIEPGKENTITDYIGGFVYETNKLQFFHMDEGRVLSPEAQNDPDAYLFAYEYHYKDHLGNLRMSLREGGEFIFEASMDTDKGTEEEAGFQNIAETRDIENETGNDAKSGDASAHLNANLPGGIQKVVGPLKEFEVEQGDQILAEVFTRYNFEEGKSTNSFSVGTILQNIIQGEGGGTSTIPFSITSKDYTHETVPNAYIRIVAYDEEGQEVQDSTQWILPAGTNDWYQMSTNLTIAFKGTVKVFVANESEMDVFFDDLKITNKKPIIAQENHYYPFGMNLTGIEKKGSPDHKFQYNGKEKQEDFDLNWYDYGWRNYDPALGRWHGVDGMSEKYVSYSPYHYAGNNPIRNYDIDGNEFTESGKKW
uniref:PKD domain-containing protein n=2 Tax=Flexithrix dorotheae TaxID=70993 RepID=UPI0005C751B6